MAAEARRTLYAPIEAYRTGPLAVGDGHTLDFEESGNPQGERVVFLHDGPGGAAETHQRPFFDTAAHRMLLFDHVDRVRDIPAVIGQGRYDVVCPMETAWALQRVWREAKLRISPDAGHSVFELGNVHSLIDATDRFRPGTQ